MRMFLFTHLEPSYRNMAWVIVDGGEPGTRTVERLKAQYGTWDPTRFQILRQSGLESYTRTGLRSRYNRSQRQSTDPESKRQRPG